MNIEKFGIQSIENIFQFPLVQQQQSLIPYLFAKGRHLLPIENTPNHVRVAMSDPLDIDSINELRLLLKKNIQVVYCDLKKIEEAIELCYHQKEEDTKKLFQQETKKTAVIDPEGFEGYDLLEQTDQNPAVKMVNAIFMEAIQQKASDIHFEPTEQGLMIRYRIDGVLQNRHTPHREFQTQMQTRIKVMAKMDIAEHRLPQDGRIKLLHGGRHIDFRVSTLPTVHGERIVLRILDKGNVVLGLDQIGMNKGILNLFRQWIKFPEGIILVTGPTGSGKTTTLYSAIHEINDATNNIITIEDPVEYKISGISQMNVNPKIELDFAKGLRHILRQDPDVIMIGEIRDKETAEIAIQASLTGHLVFSTLHTNDAPSALTRLADMGIEPYLLASSILGIVAQRLVRQICPHCKVIYTPSEKEQSTLALHEKKLYKGQGCPQCFQTGYKGRRAIYELMPMHAKIKAQVLKSQDAVELRKVAISEKMQTLFEYGIEWVKEGITTCAELLRVTRTESSEVS